MLTIEETRSAGRALHARLDECGFTAVAIKLPTRLDRSDGVVLYKRSHPVWEDKAYATHTWGYEHTDDRAWLGNGHYDLSFEDGVEDFKERARF